MKIIRDDQMFGLAMIPLFVEWGIKRCNQKDCTNRPSTIVRVSGAENTTGEPLAFGLCEEHYQQSASSPGEVEYNLVFDDYDAFKKEELNERND